jgi:tetratricopeptide (TPR) repeat protein
MQRSGPGVAWTLAVSVAMLAWLSVSDAAAQSRWAVVVGIDDYPRTGMSPLGGAVADAEAMAEAFKRYVEVPPSNVILLTSKDQKKPTRDAIIDALDYIKAQTKPNAGADDLLLFFFAGHGVETATGHFLMTYDTEVRNSEGQISRNQVIASSLDAELLRRAIESINVRHRIVMIDTCRTDPLLGVQTKAGESYEKQFRLQTLGESGSRATYLSTRTGYNAYEWTAKGRGFFSYYLEKGLSGAAEGYDPEVTLSSLDSYLNSKVKRAVAREIQEEQHPISFISDGALTLVRPERMSTTAAQTKLEESKARTIFGIVRNADKQLLANANVMAWRRTTSRDLRLSGTRRVDAATPRPDYVVRSDENGVFRIDGLPGDVELDMHIELAGHQPQLVTAAPAEKEFYPVVLARNGETLTAAASAPTPGATPRGLDLAGLASREHAAVARESFLVEEFDVAGDDAREALTFDPGNALAHAMLGNVLASEVTRNEATPRDRRRTLLSEARAHIDRAIASSPDLALAHNASGLTFFAEGRLNEAQAAFMTAIRLDDTLSVAHANLANVHRRRKRWAEAEASFRRAIALRPDNAIPYNGLANVLWQQKRYADAAAAARDAIAEHDGSDLDLAQFYVSLATIQYDGGNQDAALNAVANAKNLGLTRHDAFKKIERGK